ncbi:MAG: TetR/AcrR family transcriptional regulator [Actinomycetota bacterium]
MKRQHPTSAYLAAGLDLLERDGYGGLKLAPLCAELDVTSGAFYHNFNSWSDYTSVLITHWKNDQTTALIEVIEAEATPADQLQTLLDFTVQLRHRAEAAIRAWSSIDPEIGRVQASVDEARISAAQAVIAGFQAPETAGRLARAAYQALVGFQVLDGSQDVSVLETSLGLVIQETLTSTPPR